MADVEKSLIKTLRLNDSSPTKISLGIICTVLINDSLIASSSLSGRHKSTIKKTPVSPDFPYRYSSTCAVPSSER